MVRRRHGTRSHAAARRDEGGRQWSQAHVRAPARALWMTRGMTASGRGIAEAMTAGGLTARWILVSIAGASMACAGASESPRFPRPDRPVARIVSSAYATEEE